MRFPGFALAGVGVLSILGFLSLATAGAQTIYRWKDEKGQWYFSDTPPSGVNAEPVGRSSGLQARDLGRAYAGFPLGKSIEDFLEGKDVERKMTDREGVQYIVLERDNAPPGAEGMMGVFVKGKLAAIELDYSGLYVHSNGGWERVIWSARDKYGPAYLAEAGASFWADNETALSLSLRLDNGVKALYGDRKLIEQGSSFKKSLAPKF